mmetsp:Transcript_16677/g.39599  ORF Transcript_16677/g.39599 Transcript_16677/m.39599 type:complete len:819 (+) Transcript_16677:140-2596(+)
MSRPNLAVSAWTDQSDTQTSIPLRGQPRFGSSFIHNERTAPSSDREPGVAQEDTSLGKELGAAVKFSYAAPAFAVQPLNMFINTFATDLYVLLEGSLPLLSFVTALARSFDVVTDPLMAWLSDQTRWKLGRRRIFIVLAAPFYAAFFTALFSPPHSLSGTEVVVWFAVFYTLFYLADTVGNIPYEALALELTEGHQRREGLFLLTKLFTFAGMLFASLGPVLVSIMLPDRESVDVNVPCSAINGSLTQRHTLQFAPAAGGGAAGSCSIAKSVPSPDGGWFYKILSASAADGASFMLHVPDSSIAGSSCPSEPDDLVCWGRDPVACAGGSCVPAMRYKMDRYPVDSWRSRSTLSITAAIFSLYYLVASLNCVRVVKERADTGRQPKVPLVGAILRTFENRAARPLLLAWTLEALGLNSVLSLLPFYMRYVIKPEGDRAKEIGWTVDAQMALGISIAAYLIAAFLAGPFWLRLMRRIGKYRCWLLYNFLNMSTNALLFVPREGQTLLLVAMLGINGIPHGGQFLVTSVLSDIIDYEEFLHGVRNEGIFTVYATLLPKLVAIPASTIPLAVLYAVGFREPVITMLQEQTPGVTRYIQMTFAAVPVFCSILSVVIKFVWYPLKTEEMMQDIREGIQTQKTSDSEVTDPVTGAKLKPLRITEEYEDMIYNLENFGMGLLTRLAYCKDMHVVLGVMQWHVTGSLGVTLVFLTATIVTAKYWIYDRILSVVPVVMVICFGFTLCHLCISMLRYRSGMALKGIPSEMLEPAITTVYEHKSSRSNSAKAKLQLDPEEGHDGQERPIMSDVGVLDVDQCGQEIEAGRS